MPALSWIGAQLSAAGTSSDELVRVEHQRQAAMTVTVRNVITSMRMMSTFDWPEFVEGVSLVDDRLRQASAFGAMDFATRDRYRHAIEDLARGSGRSELEVTQAALEFTRAAPLRGGPAPGGQGDRRTDPGHYLISKGRPALEAALGYRLPLRRQVLRAYVSTATASYLGTILFVTCFLVALPLIQAYQSGMGLVALALLSLVALVPTSDLAIALVNRAVMAMLGPRRLPRMELATGIPGSLRTLVVVPTLLTSVEEVQEQIGRLEVHYLTNAEGEIWFALLSDWTDAATETTPDDAERLDGGPPRNRGAQRGVTAPRQTAAPDSSCSTGRGCGTRGNGSG